MEIYKQWNLHKPESQVLVGWESYEPCALSENSTVVVIKTIKSTHFWPRNRTFFFFLLLKIPFYMNIQIAMNNGMILKTWWIKLENRLKNRIITSSEHLSSLKSRNRKKVSLSFWFINDFLWAWKKFRCYRGAFFFNFIIFQFLQMLCTFSSAILHLCRFLSRILH